MINHVKYKLMNDQFPQNSITLSGVLEHQVASVDSVIFLKVAAESSAKLLLHDDQPMQEQKSITYHIVLEKNAKLIFLLAILQAQNLDLTIYLYLEDDGAQAELFGLYGLDGQQQCSIKTYQMHYGVGTQSSVVLKGMLKDQVQASVQGLIFIDHNARKTNASQENKNIVMGNQARVISVPSIEVLQHDVNCCHGTAVGQFDEQHRWYLQSRGFTMDQVSVMLIHSFFGDVVEKFDDQAHYLEMLCKKMI